MLLLNQFAPSVGFGASGVRALVSDLTPQVAAAYVRAFVQHLGNAQEIESGRCVLGWDLRPSSINVDTTDGLRSEVTNGDIVHLRPSGNAPELRCYTESISGEQALLLLTKALEVVRLSFNKST